MQALGPSELSVQPCSPRLTFRLLAAGDLTIFHELALDDHVRRFLLDGQRMERSWCAELIETSAREFARSKLGLWLLFERGAEQQGPIGFAGFWGFDGVGSTLQLLYALKAEHTGRGYAGEAATALIDFARAHRSLAPIDASVDEPNVASCRVLTRLGFVAQGEAPGAFGKMIQSRLPAGTPPREQRSKRLLLRPWRDADLDAFAHMNADPEVMAHFPATLTRAESEALAKRIRQDFEQNGYGLWALELPGSVPFIGFAGLSRPRFESHFTPAVEVGYRLSRAHWGHGYAAEAGRAVLRTAFVHLGLDEVVSFTAAENVRSQRVMQKLGMRRDANDDFDHPALPVGHRLRRHVLYRLQRAHSS